MRRLIVLISLLLTVSCGGGSGSQQAQSPGPAPQEPAVQQGAGHLRLVLEAVPDGSRWRVNLVAPAASDLYQLAGTLTVEPAGLRIVNVEAGGGLGGPEDAYFLASNDTPGRIDFAYTMRRFGPGASGRASLLSVVVEADGAAPLTAAGLEAAFQLVAEPSRLRVRDSQRRTFAVEVQQ